MQCNVKLVDAGFVLDQLASYTIMCISTQKLKPYTLLSMVHTNKCVFYRCDGYHGYFKHYLT